MAIVAAVVPTVIGIAAQTVPSAYSWRSVTGAIRRMRSSRFRRLWPSRTVYGVRGCTG